MTEMLTQDDRPEVDQLLQDYFQAEMPKPWPQFKAPRAARPQTTWARYSGRMALAACVSLLVAGYLMLGGAFPAMSRDPNAVHDVVPPIGMKEGQKRDLPKNQKPAEDDRVEPMGTTR